MGQYKNIYIEVKNPKTNQWELFHQYAKLSLLGEGLFNANNDGSYSVNIVCSGDEQYKDIICKTVQGSVRDYLDDSFTDLSNRGLPKDISKELSNSICIDEYDYNISYATIEEIINDLSHKIDEYNNKLQKIKNTKTQYENLDVINKKLDLLFKASSSIIYSTCGYITGEYMDKQFNNVKTIEPNINPNDYTDEIAELEELIEDYEFVEHFINSIYFMLEYNYPRIKQSDVRLVHKTN
jgi:hypothetical protein